MRHRRDGISKTRRSGFGICEVAALWILTFAAFLIIGPACRKTAKPGESPKGMGEAGRAVFEKYCSPCHLPDSTETKLGPGFKGLFKRQRLPLSGKPVTEANIRHQLAAPYRDMPPFTSIPEEKIAALIGYLKTR